jgi:hypothetical protein
LNGKGEEKMGNPKKSHRSSKEKNGRGHSKHPKHGHKSQRKERPEPKIVIIHPGDNDAVAKKTLDITIHVMSKSVHCGHKEIKPLMGRKNIALFLDGKVAAESRLKKGNKASYTTTLNLEELEEGAHTIQAMLYSKARRPKKEAILDSEPVTFLLDRTPPVLHGIFPSDGVTVKKEDFTHVLVEAEDTHSGLDINKCSAHLDGGSLQSPGIHAQGLVFQVPQETGDGVHQIDVHLGDNAGNTIESRSRFEVKTLSADEKAKEEKLWEERHQVLKEKLSGDPGFQKQLLTSPEQAFARFDLPYTRSTAAFLPPPLPEEHADFFLNNDSEAAAKVLGPLKNRIIETLEKRDNQRIAKIVKEIAKEELVADDGSLTLHGKKAYSSLFQDPQELLEKLGVTLTDEEKKFIPPKFPEACADAMAETVSVMQSGRLKNASPEKRSALEEARLKASSDPEEQLKWLTQPEAAFKAAYPQAAPLDLSALPGPMPEEEARRLLSPPPSAVIKPPEEPVHNSTDAVIGVSAASLNQALEVYFSEVNPVFPITKEDQFTTGAPFPFGAFSYNITINPPGNLQIVDTAKKLISASVDGSAIITLEDGTEYGITLMLTPIYSIFADDSFIYLDYNTIKVDFKVILAGVEVPLSDVSEVIADFIDKIVFMLYPAGRIPLVRQSRLQQGIQTADVEVYLDRVHVHHDKDPLGSGEIYFEIEIGGTKYFFGEYKVSSGSSARLDRRILLDQGQLPIRVSVRGIDRDLGFWPNKDDYLGDGVNVHYQGGQWQYGRFSLKGKQEEIRYKLVWDIIYWTLVVVFCWFEEIVVEIFNACGELIGYKTRLKKRCRKALKEVYGWVTQAFTVNATNFILEYTINPKQPVKIAPKYRQMELDNKAIYLGFDFYIPGIADHANKTSAKGFIGSADAGMAISENFLDKLIRLLWRYCPISTIVTAGGIHDREFHAQFEVGSPDTRIWNNQSVSLYFPIDGKAGANLGPLHINLGTPSSAQAYLGLAVENGTLTASLEQLWFSGGNVSTRLMNLLSMLYYLFTVRDREQQRRFVLLDEIVRFNVGDRRFQLKPYPPMYVNERELILNFSFNGLSGMQALPVNTIYCPTPPNAGKFQGVPCLLFVVNKNRGHMEIHRMDCTWAGKIHPRNRRLIHGTPGEINDLYEEGNLPEYVVAQLQQQGYNGCYYCLPEIHTK